MSNHPPHCKVGLIYGQALRVIERCSDQADAELHLENLKCKLLDRNYPEKEIQKQFTRARKSERTQLINQNRIRLTPKALVKAIAFYFYNHCLTIAKCHPVPGTN